MLKDFYCNHASFPHLQDDKLSPKLMAKYNYCSNFGCLYFYECYFIQSLSENVYLLNLDLKAYTIQMHFLFSIYLPIKSYLIYLDDFHQSYKIYMKSLDLKWNIMIVILLNLYRHYTVVVDSL